jgi:hypothetical protein
MAGVGLDAALVREVNPRLKRLAGQGAFWFAALQQFVRWEPRRFIVEVGAQQHAATFALLANATCYAGAMRIAAQASLTSDRLEHEPTIHFLVEVEVKGVEGFAAIAEAGLHDPPFEEAVLAAHELVLNELERKSMGASLAVWASSSRDSRPATMPEQRSWRRARCSSTRFMSGSPRGFCAR